MRGVPSYIDCTATIGGAELEVRCMFDYQPPAPDVNVNEEVTLECVWFEDQGNLIGRMSPDEIEILEEDLLLEVRERIADEWELRQERRYSR